MSRQGSRASSKKPQKRTHGRTAAKEVLQNPCFIRAASLPHHLWMIRDSRVATYIHNGWPPPPLSIRVWAFLNFVFLFCQHPKI